MIEIVRLFSNHSHSVIYRGVSTELRWMIFSIILIKIFIPRRQSELYFHLNSCAASCGWFQGTYYVDTDRRGSSFIQSVERDWKSSFKSFLPGWMQNEERLKRSLSKIQSITYKLSVLGDAYEWVLPETKTTIFLCFQSKLRNIHFAPRKLHFWTNYLLRTANPDFLKRLKMHNRQSQIVIVN